VRPRPRTGISRWTTPRWCPAGVTSRDTVPHLYARRFGIEHSYKFDKQALLWTGPRLRTPAQMERWTGVVAAVHNQLVLARPLAVIAHRPWETAARPGTPQQVRRAMTRIIAGSGRQPGCPDRAGKRRAPSCSLRRGMTPSTRLAAPAAKPAARPPDPAARRAHPPNRRCHANAARPAA